HKKEIKHFFEQYKALEPGKKVMPGDYWTDKEHALACIQESQERFAQSKQSV
ncbi:MAG: inorganic diphosphatase, partial [Bifidobacteriaceae bacterium]|nr:inorganic diphosphatase [Bifidobacteriaceae bacterium]